MILHPSKQHYFSHLAERRQQRRIVRAAIERAYTAFGQIYPQWTTSLFDKHFIGQTVLLWLTAPQPTYKVLTPRIVAAAWATQVCAQPARQQVLLTECLPVAAAFLELLQQELATAQTVLPIFVHTNSDGQLIEALSMSVPGAQHV